MKNFFLIGILTFLTLNNSFSQIEKGNLIIGGSADFSFLNANQSYLNINSNCSIFLKNNFSLGIGPSFSYANKNLYAALGLTSRLYFLKKENSSFFGVVTSGFFDLTEKFGNLRNSYYASFGMGYTWFLRKNIGFEIKLIGNTIDFRFDRFGMNCGFQIYLDREKKE